MGLTSTISPFGGNVTRFSKDCGTPQGVTRNRGAFFQAIIQLAAANLKCFMGHDAARRNLLQRCARRLSGLPEHYMGVNVTDLRSKLPSSLTVNHTYQLCLKLK